MSVEVLSFQSHAVLDVRVIHFRSVVYVSCSLSFAALWNRFLKSKLFKNALKLDFVWPSDVVLVWSSSWNKL
jgi:hypothetical protein